MGEATVSRQRWLAYLCVSPQYEEKVDLVLDLFVGYTHYSRIRYKARGTSDISVCFIFFTYKRQVCQIQVKCQKVLSVGVFKSLQGEYDLYFLTWG